MRAEKWESIRANQVEGRVRVIKQQDFEIVWRLFLHQEFDFYDGIFVDAGKIQFAQKLKFPLLQV